VDFAAANAIVINADTNAILYQKNDADKIASASTAKMITALKKQR
jgi:D-alanyl-D-alanine carboxypeptidase (penicillin-binding protein 5/6)